MPQFPNKAKFQKAQALRKTDSALLVEVDGEEVWLPQSQIDDDSEVFDEGHSGTLVVSEWIAKQKGLI